jgi:hypothetical protein
VNVGVVADKLSVDTVTTSNTPTLTEMPKDAVKVEPLVFVFADAEFMPLVMATV